MIDVWTEVVGECDCGVLKSEDDPIIFHDHRIMCDYGEIGNPAPNSQLMLTVGDHLKRLIEPGVHTCEYGIETVTSDGHFHYLHCIDDNGTMTTWRCEPARWADNIDTKSYGGLYVCIKLDANGAHTT